MTLPPGLVGIIDSQIAPPPPPPLSPPPSVYPGPGGSGGGPNALAAPTVLGTAPPNPNGPGQPDLNSDPGVIAAIAYAQQGEASLDAQLKAQQQQALINFGDPTMAQGYSLDPETAAYITQNYQSGNATLAKLDQAHKLARAQIINRLAARGLLHSGDTGYQGSIEDQGYGNNVYDAKQQLLGYLSQLLSGYNDKRSSYEQAVLQAKMSALQNMLNNPDAYTTGGQGVQSGGGQPWFDGSGYGPLPANYYGEAVPV